MFGNDVFGNILDNIYDLKWPYIKEISKDIDLFFQKETEEEFIYKLNIPESTLSIFTIRKEGSSVDIEKVYKQDELIEYNMTINIKESDDRITSTLKFKTKKTKKEMLPNIDYEKTEVKIDEENQEVFIIYKKKTPTTPTVKVVTEQRPL